MANYVCMFEQPQLDCSLLRVCLLNNNVGLYFDHKELSALPIPFPSIRTIKCKSRFKISKYLVIGNSIKNKFKNFQDFK